MKNDDRYTEDMFLRALLGVPWMIANSLELVESEYGLPIVFTFTKPGLLDDVVIKIPQGNALIDGLLSLDPLIYHSVNNYRSFYPSFIQEYERWLHYR